MQEKRLMEAKKQIEKLERDVNRLKANQVNSHNSHSTMPRGCHFSFFIYK